jgi:hypothetical protein
MHVILFDKLPGVFEIKPFPVLIYGYLPKICSSICKHSTFDEHFSGVTLAGNPEKMITPNNVRPLFDVFFSSSRISRRKLVNEEMSSFMFP